MKNIIQYDKIPDDYKTNFIGTGYNGSCYYIGNNKVFKELYYPDIIKDSIKNLLNVNIPSFVFPKELVYDDNKFIGYTMDYIEGVSLNTLNYAPLDDYLKEIELFEYNIASMTKRDLLMADFKEENIIYTKDNKFKVVDTDFYLKIKDRDLYKINLYFLSTSILSPMMCIYSCNFKDREHEYHKELLLDSKFLPSEFLLEILKDLRSKVDYEINNINDVKKSMGLILK